MQFHKSVNSFLTEQISTMPCLVVSLHNALTGCFSFKQFLDFNLLWIVIADRFQVPILFHLTLLNQQRQGVLSYILSVCETVIELTCRHQRICWWTSKTGYTEYNYCMPTAWQQQTSENTPRHKSLWSLQLDHQPSFVIVSQLTRVTNLFIKNYLGNRLKIPALSIDRK